ncbi:ABC transporter ATP-binding protein [Oceanobacter mangrovi]|uniref:ABC transporter ATP-binding protein n=1 Tax=Oceanobacter mangrovi TaxID=2862510 RepID=UPI001C8E3FB7|nr:ABC transporter ATP-binding protein [Oceanobacter mangrovi]
MLNPVSEQPSTATSAVLEARQLHFSYGASQAVLHGLDFAIMAGEVVSLLGTNGCGKSTLMRLLLGLLTPAQGSICLHGKPLQRYSRTELAQHIAWVPQSQPMPFPYKVADLVAMGRLPQRGLFQRLQAEDHQLIHNTLQRLGIVHLSDRLVSELSGGQQQLCLIARALVQQASIILLDEPVTGLDYGNQWRLLQLIRELGQQGVSIIKTSHYPDHAVGIADRVVMMEQGRVFCDGSPQQVLTPANLQRLYGLPVQVIPLFNEQLAILPVLAARQHPLSQPASSG